MAKKSALIEETPEEVTIVESTPVEEVTEVTETEKPYETLHTDFVLAYRKWLREIGEFVRSWRLIL